jgi:hypothetical protein
VYLDTPENVEAWQGIATCLHSIVGWWADQAADEENDDDEDEEDEEEPEDELSLPVYSTERGQMSLQGKCHKGYRKSHHNWLNLRSFYLSSVLVFFSFGPWGN